MSETLDEMVGRWVQVRVNMVGWMSTGHLYFGVVEGVDEGALLLRTPEGETLYLLHDTIRDLRLLPTPPKETDRLLRPAAAPEEEHLLRPATHTPESDPDTLLRPDDPDEMA